MAQEFGVITDSEISEELYARGIRITPVSPDDQYLTPAVTFPPPVSPQQPITVSPPTPIDYYEPFVPYYPPPTVSPEEEILPYIPAGPEPVAVKGMNKWVLVVLGVAAFALVGLSKPTETPQRRRARPRPRRRQYYEPDYEEEDS